MQGQKFRHGQIVITPGALEAFREANESPQGYLQRHLSGDWGEVDAEDKAANDHALLSGVRILSAYTLKNGTPIWIITEADRSSSTILLPSEY